MSPAAKAIAYGIVSLAAFALMFWWMYAVLDRTPQGCHAREDAPTLGDAIAAWIRERFRAIRQPGKEDRPCTTAVTTAATAITRTLARARTAVTTTTTERVVRGCLARPGRLRVPAAASAPGDGTVPDVLSTVQGAVPLEVRVTASDGLPAVAFRPGKQPWETAGQPRLPEVMQ